MRGRKPLPAHLHIIKGNGTPENTSGVEYTTVTPDQFPPPPPHLTADGAQLWNDIGRELTACGVLQVVDLYALAQLAYTWQRHMVKAKMGAEIISAEAMALRSLFAEFGMTPSSRRRVTDNGHGDKDKKNRFKKFKQAQ